jgi:hypothetical protein
MNSPVLKRKNRFLKFKTWTAIKTCILKKKKKNKYTVRARGDDIGGNRYASLLCSSSSIQCVRTKFSVQYIDCNTCFETLRAVAFD